MFSQNPASSKTITAAFDEIHPNNPAISLTKYYKGIALSENVRVLDIRPEFATVQASNREIFPALEGDIHLHSPTFSRSISGQIHPVDYTRGLFLLSDFTYTNWKERGHERVHPKESIYLKLHHNRETYRAFLEDISISGMGIMGNKAMDPFNQLRVGENVALEFHLAEDYTFSDLAGKLVYRQKVGLHLLKFGLQLFPNAFQKDSLEQYINQRTDEILDEIKQSYLRGFEPHRVENQYF